MLQNDFIEIAELIKLSRISALKAVNTELINLYWNVEAYISRQIKASSWGEKTVHELAAFSKINHPELKGFNRRGLYRMKQFYETYASVSFVSPAMTQIQIAENEESGIVSSAMTQMELSDIKQSILTKISWTHHLTLISRTTTDDGREFYLRMCVKERYTVRELDRQISAGLFERTMLGNTQLSPSLKEKHPNILNSFKDSYVFETVEDVGNHTAKAIYKKGSQDR